MGQKERCLNLFTSGESRERVKAERGSVKEGMLTCLLLMFAQLFERNLHLRTKGIGIKLGGLCLGVHETWRTGGAGARVGAAGFVSRRKEPVIFLERLAR